MLTISFGQPEIFKSVEAVSLGLQLAKFDEEVYFSLVIFKILRSLLNFGNF